MNRQEKQICVDAIKQEFLGSSAAFIVGVQGLTVQQIHGLRASLRKQHGTLRVVKNTLSRRALVDIAAVKGLEDHLSNQVALVFAHEDPAATAKLLCAYAKEHTKLAIVAGCLDARVMDQDMVKYLGTLPSREIVIAQACGALQAPIANHIGLLKQLIARFLMVLKAIETSKEV